MEFYWLVNGISIIIAGITPILLHTVLGTGGQRRFMLLTQSQTAKVSTVSAAAADSLWTQVTRHRPSDVTDLRKRISSHVSVLHISGEILDQFFMQVHRRSSTQQCSPTPLCIIKNVTWLCDSLLAHSLSVTWQDRDPQLSERLGFPTGDCIAHVRMKLAQNT